MIMPFRPLPMTMAALLLLSSCAAQIHDGPLCSPIPTLPGQCRGSAGAACDQFLNHAPADLDADQWEATQQAWEDQGCVVMETTSCFVSQLKAEIEKLCTVASCTAAQSAQMAKVSANYDRLVRVAKRARARAKALGLELRAEQL